MIRGEQVNLRAVDRTDAALLHRWLNDPAVMTFWGAPDHTISLAEIQRRVEVYLAEEAELGRPVCLVVETLAGEAIGQVFLSHYQPEAGSVELAIMIGESAWWGQGYGTDALKAIVDACFDAWNLHRIWLRSEASNERAHRLYTRCGFVREAVLREAAYLDGQYEDVILFGLLGPDRATAAARASEDTSFVFGLLGSEEQAQVEGQATPAVRRPVQPIATATEARPPQPPEDDSADRASIPDASDPRPIKIPDEWLKPEES